ncbi:MAG: helix-turn-helix domain-containing protein [Gammaproteobacteria bacterium]
MRLSKALDYFGSMKALADALGLNSSTVQAWKKSGLVPAKWEATVKQLMKQPALKNLEQKSVSVDSIIAQHGSVKALAQILKVTPNTVYRWRDSGRIPNESLAKLAG